MKTIIRKGDARNLPVLRIVVVILLLLILIPISLGSINLTISSTNHKNIEVVNSTNYVLGNYSQNTIFSVPYDNLDVKVSTNNTLTMNNLRGALTANREDLIMIFIIMIIVVIVCAVLWM